MYCDICEEFDLHETEDCPTQGEDEPVPVSRQLGKEPKEKPPPRAYCEICGGKCNVLIKIEEQKKFSIFIDATLNIWVVNIFFLNEIFSTLVPAEFNIVIFSSNFL